MARYGSETSLTAPPPDAYDGPPPRSRPIAVSTPLLRGRDVRLVQLMLTAPSFGEQLIADAVFGQATAAAVQRLQARLGRPASGRVDEPVFDALGL
jgi:chitosanase